MPRIRSVKPEFWVSESLSRMSRDTRLTFIGLWTCADDFGRFRADPRYLAGQLYPYDSDGLKVVTQSLRELEDEGAVLLYEADRSHYGLITGWRRHQRIDKPSASKFPQPPEIKLANIREPSRSPPGALPEGSCEDQGREQGEEQGREGSREQGGDRPTAKKRLPAKSKKSDGPKQVKLLEAETKPRPPSRIGKLWEEFQAQREAKITGSAEDGGLEMAEVQPDEPPDWGKSAATLGQWLKLWPDLSAEDVDHRLAVLMTAWMENTYWASSMREGKPAVIYPWGAFIAEKQWRRTFSELFPGTTADGGVH